MHKIHIASFLLLLLISTGIVVVGSFAALLAASNGEGSLTAAMGILGAIAGYLFGIKDSK
jgi:hypothetical protein